MFVHFVQLHGLKDCNFSFYLNFFVCDLIRVVTAEKIVLVQAEKTQMWPFCGPEGRFDCSESVFSLRPAPPCYLCVRVSILCVLKIVCCWE